MTPETATFRVPLVSLAAVLVSLIAAIPLAASAPGLEAVLALPLGLGIWVVRTRTVVGSERLAVRRLLSTRRLDWAQVVSLRVSAKRWVRVVLTDGTEVMLPAVRARDLPRLAAASGGRFPTPAEPTTAGEPAAAEEPTTTRQPATPGQRTAAGEPIPAAEPAGPLTAAE